MQLRPYQEEAMCAVFREWEEGHRKTLLVLATGLGKTIVFSKIIEKRIKEDKNARILVLAHRGELLEQAREKLQLATGLHSALEKASETTVGSDERIVVGSVQSMAGTRLESFPVDYFTDIIVDEAHHCVSDTYQKVLARFPHANVLGVTATPNRADKKSLARFFDSTAFEYGLAEGVRDGYLSPISVQRIPLSLDITNVSVNAGDYSAGELGDALEGSLNEIADNLVRYCHRKKTIVFTPLIKTSEKLLSILKEKGMRVAEVNGQSENRKEILKKFDDGEYEILINSMLLTEGFDSPSVNCIVVLRPTKSTGLYTQMVGRGTRLAPEKSGLLLLDFLWLTGKHDICHPASLVATTDEIARKMCHIVDETSEEISLEELEEKAKREVARDLERSLAEELAKNKAKKSEYISSLQFFASIGEIEQMQEEPIYAWEKEPPTEKQLAALSKFGLDVSQIDTKGLACKIQNIIMKRMKAGLSSVKQIKLLERYGFIKVGTWTLQEASEVITKIAKNNWRVPYGMSLTRPGFKVTPFRPKAK